MFYSKLVVITLVTALVLALWLPTGAADELDASIAMRLRHKQIQQLRRNINFYNLINGLHLSQKQIGQIIELATAARQLRPKYHNQELNPITLKQRLAVLQKMQEYAQSGQSIPQWLARSYHTANQGRRRHVRPDRGRYLLELKKLEQRLEQLLLNSQKQVLADYKPCLILPKNLRSPVRVGQANDSEAGMRILERLRRIHDEWQTYFIMERTLERIEEHHGRYSPEERRAIMTRWYDTVTKARQMSDVEFEISKAELAAQIRPPDKKEQLQALLARHARNHNLPGKAAHFLLDPAIIPILQKRYQQMLRSRPGKAIDLSQIPQKADTSAGGRDGALKEK